MSDKLPYEGAIEETAKTAGKALELVQAAAPAIGEMYGFLIGDTIQHARAKRLESMAEKAKRLADRGVTEKAETPERLGIPLLEAAQTESREEMIDLWARLLANAMDPNRIGDVRSEYIEIIKKFEPLDVRIMDYIASKNPATDRTSKHQIFELIGCRESAAVVSVNNLEAIGCVRLVGGNHFLALSELGREIVIAVQP
jgi:Abortive infection alpha